MQDGKNGWKLIKRSTIGSSNHAQRPLPVRSPRQNAAGAAANLLFELHLESVKVTKSA
jgi:hypothetical protein